MLLSLQKPRKRRVGKTARERIMARDGHSCFYCGGTKDLQVDHIVAVAIGGMDDDSNLVTACAKCNRDKRTSSPVVWKERMLKRMSGG